MPPRSYPGSLKGCGFVDITLNGNYLTGDGILMTIWKMEGKTGIYGVLQCAFFFFFVSYLLAACRFGYS